MASNSNVIKVEFEYTSEVVAKLVIKNRFLRIPLIVSLRFLPVPIRSRFVIPSLVIPRCYGTKHLNFPFLGAALNRNLETLLYQFRQLSFTSCFWYRTKHISLIYQSQFSLRPRTFDSSRISYYMPSTTIRFRIFVATI